jgi:hypothetical protein
VQPSGGFERSTDDRCRGRRPFHQIGGADEKGIQDRELDLEREPFGDLFAKGYPG